MSFFSLKLTSKEQDMVVPTGLNWLTICPSEVNRTSGCMNVQ